jgi:hypothetical protein
MRLTDLLGAEVVDGAGRSAGRVHDVRLVQDGPPAGPFGAALRVDGLIVGGWGLGARLGYDRTAMHGPWLVKVVTGWLRRDGRWVAWSRVRAVEPDRVHIAGAAADLPHPDPIR